MPVHGTRGTTGSEDCLLLYSGVGKSLIFPIALFLLPKFDAGKPGGESGSASVCTDALPVFSAQSGRRVWGRSAVQHCASSVFWETPGQSCCHSRIGWSNPVATAGLGGAILLPQQDWVEQSCCHSRIGWSNPVATAGLTAGRVSGEKNTPSAILRGQHR